MASPLSSLYDGDDTPVRARRVHRGLPTPVTSIRLTYEDKDQIEELRAALDLDTSTQVVRTALHRLHRQVTKGL